VGLGELGQFFAWVDREHPSPEAQRAVRVFLAGAGAEPWLTPSTPIAELSNQPDDEVRSAHLRLADGSTVKVWYRHTYVTQQVDVIEVTGPEPG